LSPALPLVLYTGAAPWQNNRSLHDLLGEPAEFHGFVPQWAPLFWELCDQDADTLLASGEAWQQTLAVLRMHGTEAQAFERVYVEALQRLEPLAEQDHVRWFDLMRIIVTWALTRRPRAERETLLSAAQATQTNVDRQKEVALVGQTIAEAIWEEGRLKGHAEGRSEGELSASRRLLRQLLEKRFGALPEAVLQRIESATDVERLTTATLEVLHMVTVEDLQL
jgi:predicted transposase YdaD